MAHDSAPDETATRLRESIDNALAKKDRAAAVKTVLDAVQGNRLGVDELYTRVLVPLLQDTGAQWQEGSTRIWEEHFATSVVRTIVESLAVEVAQTAEHTPRLGKTAVLACPPGEQHELGLRMLADRMTLAGWNAHFLGADTPVEEIAAAARALGADVVALSVATHYNRLLLRESLDRLRALLPDVRIGVGGPAFAHDPEARPEDSITEAELGLDGASERARRG
jgi:MerR family transcriptional regulator, light-induced transcriptional regulator